MLRPVSTSSASASVAPVAVRGAAAAGIAAEESRASVANAASPTAQQSSAPEPSAIFRYNSFEFVYRQDIGRIILVGQSPETGERVVQVPSEQVLAAYERTVRAEKALNKHEETSTPATPSVSAPPPTASSAPQAPAPQLAQSLAAAVGGGGTGGSAFVSISA